MIGIPTASRNKIQLHIFINQHPARTLPITLNTPSTPHPLTPSSTPMRNPHPLTPYDPHSTAIPPAGFPPLSHILNVHIPTPRAPALGPTSGDTKFMITDKEKLGSKRGIGHFWTHTYFLQQQGGRMVLRRRDTDKACKSKYDDKFSPDFEIILETKPYEHDVRPGAGWEVVGSGRDHESMAYGRPVSLRQRSVTAARPPQPAASTKRL